MSPRKSLEFSVDFITHNDRDTYFPQVTASISPPTTMTPVPHFFPRSLSTTFTAL